MVQAAIEHERQTSQLVSLLRKVCARRGNAITPETARALSNYSIQYVSLVPQYLEEGKHAAFPMGISKEMDFMLSELEAYWFTQMDLIPDYLGLAGIMDDAYASLYLLQMLSEHCERHYDRPLLIDDLTLSNAFARDILGETIATALERKVKLSLNANLAGSPVNHILQTIISSGFMFPHTITSLHEQEAAKIQARLHLGNQGVYHAVARSV